MPALIRFMERRMDHPQKYVFIEGVGELFKQRGYPDDLAPSTLQKYCKPSDGRGPKPVGKWGKRNIYLPRDWLQWAEARIKLAGASK